LLLGEAERSASPQRFGLHPVSAKGVGLSLFIAILALAPILLAISQHASNPKPVLMAVLVSLILVSAACHYFATRIAK
jgi:hypothetical protein